MCDRWQPTSISTRTVVADDGRSTRLLIYRGESVIAIVPLEAVGALGLASRLIDAARRHLPPTPIVVHVDGALAKV